MEAFAVTHHAPLGHSAKRPWTYWLWPLRWRPLLDLWVDVGLLQVSTNAMSRQVNMDAVLYLSLRITLLHKWGFHVRLYDTGLRQMENRR